MVSNVSNPKNPWSIWISHPSFGWPRCPQQSISNQVILAMFPLHSNNIYLHISTYIYIYLHISTYIYVWWGRAEWQVHSSANSCYTTAPLDAEGPPIPERRKDVVRTILSRGILRREPPFPDRGESLSFRWSKTEIFPLLNEIQQNALHNVDA